MSDSPTPDDVANATPAIDETLFERRMRSLTLRNSGATYSQIAQRMEVSEKTSRDDVRKALREVISEPAEDLMARQRSVLLDLQRANYPQALRGDKDAGRIVIDCLKHEAQLMGLYAPTRVNVAVTDVEFAEQAVTLISELGLQPPAELVAAAATDPVLTDAELIAATAAGGVDDPDVIDAEVEDEDEGWADI